LSFVLFPPTFPIDIIQKQDRLHLRITAGHFTGADLEKVLQVVAKEPYNLRKISLAKLAAALKQVLYMRIMDCLGVSGSGKKKAERK
jgi:hypothetical protein